MMKMVVIFLSLLYYSAGIFAQPQLSNIEGQYAEGQLLTDFGNGVQDAEIFVMDESGTLLPVSVSTEASGRFILYGIPVTEHFYVKPFKDDNPANGLDVWDLYQLTQTVKTAVFDSPYQKLAADINEDEIVDDKDILALSNFLLGKSSVLDKTIFWRFYDANCLPPMSSPFGACAKTKEFVIGQEERFNLNFVAIKVGDLNNSAVSNITQKAKEHVYGDVLLNTINQVMVSGQEYELSFKTTDEKLLAYQFSLNLGSLELIDFDECESGLENQIKYHKQKNIISIVTLEPTDNQLIKLHVRATEDASLSDVLSMDTDLFQSKAYNEDEKSYTVKLAFDGKQLDKLVLFQNEPNPFMEETNIRFFLPSATTATLTIYDINGHRIKVIKDSFGVGMNQIAVKKAVFNASGIYFYKLETDEQSAIRKMVILD